MSDLSARLEDLKTKLKLEEIVAEKVGLLSEMESADFWNGEGAQKKSQRLAEIDDTLNTYKEVQGAISDAETAEAMLADDYENKELIADNQKYQGIAESALAKLEMATYLSGRYDGLDAILSIHAGAGGLVRDGRAHVSALRRAQRLGI